MSLWECPTCECENENTDKECMLCGDTRPARKSSRTRKDSKPSSRRQKVPKPSSRRHKELKPSSRRQKEPKPSSRTRKEPKPRSRSRKPSSRTRNESKPSSRTRNEPSSRTRNEFKTGSRTRKESKPSSESKPGSRTRDESISSSNEPKPNSRSLNEWRPGDPLPGTEAESQQLKEVVIDISSPSDSDVEVSLPSENSQSSDKDSHPLTRFKRSRSQSTAGRSQAIQSRVDPPQDVVQQGFVHLRSPTDYPSRRHSMATPMRAQTVSSGSSCCMKTFAGIGVLAILAVIGGGAWLYFYGRAWGRNGGPTSPFSGYLNSVPTEISLAKLIHIHQGLRVLKPNWVCSFPDGSKESLMVPKASEIPSDVGKKTPGKDKKPGKGHKPVKGLKPDPMLDVFEFKIKNKKLPNGIWWQCNGEQLYYDIGANIKKGRVKMEKEEVPDTGMFKVKITQDEIYVSVVEATGNRFALLVTISYAKSGENMLPGTEDDGKRMYEFLSKKGFDVIWMQDFSYDEDHHLYPSRENIETKIREFVKGKNAGDVLWLQYSGHGTQIKHTDGGAEEADGFDEAICPADNKEKGVIKDDWLYKEFVSKIPPFTETMVMFDCCHSGTLMDLPYIHEEGKGFVRQDARQKKSVPENVKVLFLSGCADPQTSKELTWTKDDGSITKRGGALTMSFLELLTKYGDELTLNKLMLTIRDKVRKQDQVPHLSCSTLLDETQPFVEVFDGAMNADK